MNLPAALPRIVGAKLPLRPMHVWTIRVRLQIERRVRDLALFDIALDSKLRGCDVVALRLADIMAAGSLKRRAGAWAIPSTFKRRWEALFGRACSTQLCSPRSR